MQLHPPLELGFLASHGGSGMRAIVAAIREGRLDAEARLVISNNAGCEALAFARSEGLPWRHISASSAGGAEAADLAIADALTDAGVGLVVLSGYMRRLGPVTLRRYRGRVLNIHPALLPRHGGQGLYGRRVHEAVHAAGDAASGATVHLVESEYDTGPILAQRQVPVHAGDGVEDIEARVRAVEPELYVETLKRIASGAIELPDPTV
jgi:phosphoribosylglycinamide formyltransferase-1